MWTILRNTLPKLVGIGMLIVALITILAACSSMGAGSYDNVSTIPVTNTTTGGTSSAGGIGVVQSINMVSRQQSGGLGIGPVAGAVVGGLLGNQIGSGTGRTAATVAGAAGGALIGDQMQRNSQAADPDNLYHVTVRMDNGAIQTLAMDNTYGLQIGQRVRVENGVIVERLR